MRFDPFAIFNATEGACSILPLTALKLSMEKRFKDIFLHYGPLDGRDNAAETGPVSMNSNNTVRIIVRYVRKKYNHLGNRAIVGLFVFPSKTVVVADTCFVEPIGPLRFSLARLFRHACHGSITLFRQNI